MATIFVVDDSPVILRMVSFTLRKNGHTVHTAASAVEALDRLLSTPVDLIMTDVNMPVMDGITFLKEIRSQPALDHVPVVLLTANEWSEIKQAAKTEGANGFMTKPASSIQLIDTVNNLLRESKLAEKAV